jgi:formate/nitrite transporter FocA (FNT family)
MSEQSDEHGDEAKAQEEHVPEGEIIYRAIRKDGDHALGLTNAELAWSGLAAGLSMGFSLAAEGVLRAHLPDAPWRPLIAKFGYAIGFLIVILGRQQLFTEQTLTAVLSLLSTERPQGTFGNVARLWSIVLVTNLIGIGIFAAFSVWTPVFTPEVQSAFSHIGQEALAPGFLANFVRAIYAGFLIATMVWLLPGSGEARLWIVVIIAWVVGIGQFAHIIAGSGEGLYVVFKGEQSLITYISHFLVPSLLGNSIGGVALVASLAHAQHAPE